MPVMHLNELWLTNIVPIVGLVFLFLTLLRSRSLSPHMRRLFYVVLVLEALELVLFNADEALSTMSHPTTLRVFTSALGYCVRPSILICLILTLLPEKRSFKSDVTLCALSVFNDLLSFSAFFSPIAFSFTADNHFVRGPLGLVSFISIYVYMIILVVVVVWRRKVWKRVDIPLIVMIFVFMFATVAAETLFDVNNIGRTAMVYCTLLYFTVLQTSQLDLAKRTEQENESLKRALYEVDQARRELELSRSVTQALGEHYLAIFKIDLTANNVSIVKIDPSYKRSNISDRINKEMPYEAAVRMYTEAYVVPSEREEIVADYTAESLRTKLSEKPMLVNRYHLCFVQDHPIAVEYQAIRMNDGDPNSVILGLRNVDEQEQAEIQAREALVVAKLEAERANAAKSNFLSRMSHDIRTPLNGIIGLLEIDDAHDDDPELLRENRQKMRVAADHLLSLINDVLQMSKLDQGEVVLGHESCDLAEISKSVGDIIQSKAVEEGITLTDKVTSLPRPYVYGSPLHLRQVFLNIYSNAVKYNKPGGSITSNVECLEESDERVTYRWTIADTGIGMTSEFVERIFDPFVQEGSATDARTQYQGTGLGMAIVKSLVEQMGGTIEVESVKGEGSTFTVTIPFEVAPAPEKAADAPAEEASIEGLSVLLAEDNDLNAEIAQTLMEDRGVHVTRVANGREAVAAFGEAAPCTYDVILMDIMMPEMNGYEATAAIRALGREDAASVPIVAMTANAFKEDEERCLEAGMNAHLAKPFEVGQLVSIISRSASKE